MNIEDSRTPPQAIEAEKAVLGSMMLDNEILLEIFELLEKDDFYREDHREVFQAIKLLHKQQSAVDVLTVSDMLKYRGSLDNIGGMESLVVMTNVVVTSANAKHYAKIVQEKSQLRRLIKTSVVVMEKAYAEEPVKEILQSTESELIEIGNSGIGSAHDITTVVDGTLEKIEQRISNPGKLPGISTGFKDYDNKISGLKPGDLIIIAARPSMGKTALAMNIAEFVAMKSKIPVLIFSLEMSKEALIERMLSGISQISNKKIKRGEVSPVEHTAIKKTANAIAESKLIIDDRSGLSVYEIEAAAMREKRKHQDLGLIVIDYLQLMKGSKKTENRTQEVTEMSKGIKIMAKQLKVPVILLSQLSRASEARADHRPILSDLRESGSIEQDADVVTFIYRDDYYNLGSDRKGIADIITAKCREGETGTISLKWQGCYTRFSNIEVYEPPKQIIMDTSRKATPETSIDTPINWDDIGNELPF